MSSRVILNSQFSSAHFYRQDKWSEEKNKQEFGACFTPYGHGHNYRVEVEFDAPSHLQSLEDLEDWSGLRELERALHEEVRRFDHAHLNFVLPEFKTQVPTTENIAKVLLERLQARGLSWPLRRLRLYEMKDLWVEVIP